MSRYLLYAVLIAAASISLFAQPVVGEGALLNGASYTRVPLPGSAIAPGSFFSIFGSGLGPTAPVITSAYPVPTVLGGTSVKVTSGGQSLDCFMLFASAGQVNAILPSNTSLGNATFTVTYAGQSSTPRSFRVVSSSFGILTINSQGTGQAIATNFESSTLQPYNTPIKAARAGQTIIMVGTGLGGLPAGTSDSAPAPAIAINQALVELYVGGRRASVSYAGRAPGFAGEDQINFIVPGDIAGCSVPVVVKIGNLVSNAATIAIGTGGSTCSDALGLPQSQLDRLSSTGSLKVGTIALARLDLEVGAGGFSINVKTDSGNANFVEFTPTSIWTSSSLNAGGASSIGTCTFYSGSASALTPVDYAPPRGLDAGALININGPKGAKSLKKVGTLIGNYAETLSSGGISLPIPGAPDGSYLDPGPYSFNNGAGGADVRGFTANLTLGAPVVWSNKAAVTNVNRAAGQTVNWTGGDSNGYVVIYGYSATDASENALLSIFTCTERASAGTFTVPASILLALPPSPTASSAGLPFGLMGVGSGNLPATFSAPGLDYAYIVSSSLTLKSVNYQ